MKFRLDKQGTALLYLLVTMTVLTVLGTGVFYMTTTSSFSGLGLNAQNKAKYLAEAGIRYALANLRTLQNTTSPLPEYTLSGAAGDKFILELSGIGGVGDVTIKSTGVSNPGTPFQASHKITVSIPSTQYQAAAGTPFSFAGTGSGGIASMTTVTGPSGVGKSGATGVLIDTSDQKISLGRGQTNTYGCAWYQGWADSNGSDCIQGKCKFNRGIRAYFDIQYNTKAPWEGEEKEDVWQGDGFTFALINSASNTISSCGGGTCSEYMAYAGPGTGSGLQPPKIAVEFDPKIDRSVLVCSGTSAQCDSRNDSAFISPHKHAALAYWGTNATVCESNTLDDNRHGNGGENDPKNPENGDSNPDDGTLPYMLRDFEKFGTIFFSWPNWGRKLAFRMEIDRVDDPASPDYRKYKIRAWLKLYAVYTDSNGVTLDDTSRKFNQNNDNDYKPNFQQTITLNETWHESFDRILFGWTQGTGELSQTVTITNFRIDFKNKNDF